jgi:serine/threonine protein kinase
MASLPRTLGWYRLIERIRVTELTETFLARGEPGLQGPEQACVTQLLPSLRANPELDRVFSAQVLQAGLIAHPNLELVLDASEHGDPAQPGAYVAHALVDAWTLRELLQKARAAGRPLPPELACTIAFDVLSALNAIHSRADAHNALMPGHLNLSPDHVTIAFDGTVRVRGLGLTLVARLAATTSSRSLAKELAWRAPTQLSGDGPQRSSDLFSVGLLLWEMLTGTQPMPRHNQLLKLGDLRPDDPAVAALDFPHLRCPSCRWRPAPTSRWKCAARCGASVTPLYTRGHCPLCGVGWKELSCLECSRSARLADWETLNAERFAAANVSAPDARVNTVRMALGAVELSSHPLPGLEAAASRRLSEVLREAFAPPPGGFRAGPSFQLALDGALAAHGLRRSTGQLASWVSSLRAAWGANAGPVPQPLSQAPTLGREELTAPAGTPHVDLTPLVAAETLPPGSSVEPQSQITLPPVRPGGPTLREGEYRAITLPPPGRLSVGFGQASRLGSDPERTAVSHPERPSVPKPLSEPEKTSIEPSLHLGSQPGRAITSPELPIEPITDPSGVRLESAPKTVVERDPRSEGGLFGSYRLVSRLGRGGMAETWRAQLVGAAGVTRPAVIKRILPNLASDPHFVSAFINEARVTATLSHGNIAQVYDFGQTSGEYFIALEYVHGRTLEAVIERAEKKGFHHLAPAVACFVVSEMLKGLQYAHTRTADDGQPLHIVHRDVSADNVIIGFDGQTKLVDFGVAKSRIKGRTETQPGLVKGKWSHFSPEQAAGEALDARSDVFTCGVVLYRMLCGQHPFPGTIERAMRAIVDGQYPPPATVNPTLADDLSAIVMRAMQNDRALRFQTADEFERALRQHLMKAAPDFNAETLKGFVLWLFEDELVGEGIAARAKKSEVERFTRWAAENRDALKVAAQRAETRSALERVGQRPKKTAQLIGISRGAAAGLLTLAALAASVTAWLAFSPGSAANQVLPEAPAPEEPRRLVGRIQDTGSSLRVSNADTIDWTSCRLWVPPDRYYAVTESLRAGQATIINKGALTRAERPPPSPTDAIVECREGSLRERL